MQACADAELNRNPSASMTLLKMDGRCLGTQLSKRAPIWPSHMPIKIMHRAGWRGFMHVTSQRHARHLSSISRVHAQLRCMAARRGLTASKESSSTVASKICKGRLHSRPSAALLTYPSYSRFHWRLRMTAELPPGRAAALLHDLALRVSSNSHLPACAC